MSSRRVWLTGALLSVVVHTFVCAGLAQLLKFVDASRFDEGPREVHVIPVRDVLVRRSVTRSQRTSSLGSPRRLRVGPADTLAASRQVGALAGTGRARPLRQAMSADDLHDLRRRLADHRTRDTPQRQRTKPLLQTPDNIERIPRRQPTADRGESPGPRGLRAPSRTAVNQAHNVARSRSADVRQDRSGDLVYDEPGAEMWHRSAPASLGRNALVRARPWGPRSTQTQRLARQSSDPLDLEGASVQRVPDLADFARPHDAGRHSGQGRGALARAAGTASGYSQKRAIWLNTPDRRYMDYFRRIYRRVQPLWSFPKHLEILLEQGDALVQFTIAADGHIDGLKVKKSSGFPEFDRRVLAALREAAPFDPIPPGLGPRLTVVAPFEFSNPMVR